MRSSSTSDDDNENDETDLSNHLWSSTTRGPEASQMLGYVSDYLRKQRQQQENEEEEEPKSSETNTNYDTLLDDDDTPMQSVVQYLLAIPMDANVQLCLDLESVQRAILYHCPILVHSCIPSAMTKLPLLYIQVPTTNSGSSSNTQSQSQTDVLNVMQSIVKSVLERQIYNTQEDEDEDDDDVETCVDQDEEGAVMSSANTKGIKPLLVPFGTLEVEGPNNNVLYTVAKPDAPGTRKLQHVVSELQTQLQQHFPDWTIVLPTRNDGGGENKDSANFCPRIPFMRLPPDWDTYLQDEKDKQQQATDVEDDSDIYLTSDQGGNGISPIFFGTWMDDDFGQDVGTRLQEIGIYVRPSDWEMRQGSSGSIDGGAIQRQDPMTETLFRLPERSIPLPQGNEALTKIEASFQKYQDERMAKAQEVFRQEEEDIKRNGKMKKASPLSPISKMSAESDHLLSMKTNQRLDDMLKEDQSIDRAAQSSVGEDLPEPATFTDDTSPTSQRGMAKDVRQRIRKTVASRAYVQSRSDLARRKEKPPIALNPIFAKYKDGTLVPKQEAPQAAPELPPFPSREHCIGFWRVVRSPTGFAVEEGDSSRSDNLILRVDGTTAGGPILDQETRQKACEGSWKLILDGTDSAQLTINLLIPPKKERVLIMEGKLERVSISNDLPMTRSTFGIPDLEERLDRAKDDFEDLLYCSGSVTIQDVNSDGNRESIGGFSIQKLSVSNDPSKLIITIPRPVRNQD